MKLLLDTHVWIWSHLEPERLKPRVARALESPDNEIWLSPISIWDSRRGWCGQRDDDSFPRRGPIDQAREMRFRARCDPADQLMWVTAGDMSTGRAPGCGARR